MGSSFDVPLIPQSTNMGCWAASICMILAWRRHASFDPTLVAKDVGGLDYTAQLSNGLDPNDRYILERNGFTLEPPQCYTQEAIEEMLTDYGPLWVAGAVPTAHIRVVRGIFGSVVLINDPAPVGTGSRYTRGFASFFGQMENLGTRELSQRAPVYVAHL